MRGALRAFALTNMTESTVGPEAETFQATRGIALLGDVLAAVPRRRAA